MEYQLNFHQSFAPETEALAQIVRVASPEMEFLTKEEISQLTAIPTGESSGKVIPHLYYAEAMNLINLEKDGTKYKFKLTPLGEVIIDEDPYFIEDLTKQICHYFLTDKYSPVILWSFVFNYFIPKSNQTFLQTQIENATKRELKSESINYSPFRTCYSADRSFGKIEVLNITGEEYEVQTLTLNKEFRHMYAYILMQRWEQYMDSEYEITINQVINQLGFGRPFIWTEKYVRDVLDMLVEDGVVGINGQLSPITVIRRTTANQILGKIYSLLL